MDIIIPMAGLGTRLRPHTLNTPKPFFKINGQSIVERLVKSLSEIFQDSITSISYVIREESEEIVNAVKAISDSIQCDYNIFVQDEALGTGHAVYCAKDSLKNNDNDVVVAFADTLFISDVKLDKGAKNTIFVKKVDNPSLYGVIKKDTKGFVTDFVEKPVNFVSDLAIIGIYYFNKGHQLYEELNYLIENKITVKGEYQLTDVLKNLLIKGNTFDYQEVNEWMDCGTIDNILNTNKKLLFYFGSNIQSDIGSNNVIIEPCYIGKNVKIENSIIGPDVSIENDVKISKSIINNSIINNHTCLQNLSIENSVIGNDVIIKGKTDKFNIGSYSQINI